MTSSFSFNMFLRFCIGLFIYQQQYLTSATFSFNQPRFRINATWKKRSVQPSYISGRTANDHQQPYLVWRRSLSELWIITLSRLKNKVPLRTVHDKDDLGRLLVLITLHWDNEFDEIMNQVRNNLHTSCSMNEIWGSCCCFSRLVNWWISSKCKFIYKSLLDSLISVVALCSTKNRLKWCAINLEG